MKGCRWDRAPEHSRIAPSTGAKPGTGATIPAATGENGASGDTGTSRRTGRRGTSGEKAAVEQLCAGAEPFQGSDGNSRESRAPGAASRGSPRRPLPRTAGSVAPEPSRASPGPPEHPRPRRSRRASSVPPSIPARAAPPAQAAAPHGPPRLTPLCSAPSPAPPPPPAAVPPPRPPRFSPGVAARPSPAPHRPPHRDCRRRAAPRDYSSRQPPRALPARRGLHFRSCPGRATARAVPPSSGDTVRSGARVRGGAYPHDNR